MDWEKMCLKVGAAAVAVALLFRLGSNGTLEKVYRLFSNQQVVAVMLYLESGRVVRPAKIPSAQVTDTQQPTQIREENDPITFAAEDAELVEVNSVCGYDVDLSTLIQKPLSWNLIQDEPTVLILHTHGTESYENTENYAQSSNYRTLDTGYNVVSIGAELKKYLEENGIGVIHDTTMYDHPSYSSSYTLARAQIRKIIEQYPSISLVLDIHRDSVENSQGQQMRFTTTKDGKKTAQLMFVVGTDANGLEHPNWRENMALAVKLHAQLEKNTAGICRSISFRSQRFNQDLSTGALIVEAGSAGNTRQEALEAIRLLAQTIVELSQGTAQT